MKTRFLLYISSIFFILFTLACQKDKLITDSDSVLVFSEDTVYFDTVLSTLGSVTRYMKLYNKHDQAIQVDNINLAKGSDSFFRLNLNGKSGKEFEDIIIPANDSIFLFIEVTIDPLNKNNPLLVKDSIVCLTNNVVQDIKLIAYGQDVIIYDGEIFKTTTWTANKPYLITNGAAIDSNEVLTIEEGTQVYFTPNSSLLVWGKVEARGTFENPIIFSGSRFDDDYQISTGEWGAVFIHQKSRDNYLEHVIIKNAVAGIQVGYPNEDHMASLTLNNCMILNSKSIGIYAFNSEITAYNTIIADCGSFAILMQMGGVYNFYHCTVSNVAPYYNFFGYSGSGRNESVAFTNYFKWFELDEDYRLINVDLPADLEVNFVNSVIYGNKEREVIFDSLLTADFNYTFDHCLVKYNIDSIGKFNSSRMISVIYDEDPAFLNDSISIAEFDFQLDSTSAALNAGSLERIKDIPELEYDFRGNLREADGLPDLGAYERL